MNRIPMPDFPGNQAFLFAPPMSASPVQPMPPAAPQSLLHHGDMLLRVADWAGQHALVLFIVSLVGLVALSWGVWRTASRWAASRRPLLSAPWLAFALRLAAAFGVIVGGAAVFAEIADKLGTGRRMGQADEVFTDALSRSVPLEALQVFAALTRLGDTATLVCLCMVVALWLCWRGRVLLAVAWVTTLSGGGLLNTTLKHVFARVRPVHDDGLVQADGFSFPSGHSSGSVVAYGMLAYLAMRLLPARWHGPVALLMLALACTIGASRMFLRVHFASDVLAGLALGLAWLGASVISIELARWWSLRRKRSRVQGESSTAG
jgi:undecaprenyl-diphosphatase